MSEHGATTAASSTVDLVHEAARAAFACGLNILPAAEDGSKAPVGTGAKWEKFKTNRATARELRDWYPGRTGIGVLSAGSASGGFEAWDFDEIDAYNAFVDTAIKCGLGDLMLRIEEGFLNDTPGGGRRFLIRCTEPFERTPNQKLARRPKRQDEKRHPNDDIKVLVELPDFAIVAPTNGRVHPTGKAYQQVNGTFSTIATVTKAERDELIAVARSLDQMPAQGRHVGANERATSRPGDEFGRASTWDSLLEPKGWTQVYTRGATTYWRRPGKTFGVSATTNHGGSDLLFVFSSSTVFDSGASYSKFGAYAALEHGGDFKAAARALASEGYGEPRSTVDSEKPKRSLQDSSSEPGRAVLIRLSDVQPEAIRWIWPRRAARGKFRLLAGDPGGGKTTLGLDETARMTTGGIFPDGAPAPLGTVLWLTAEDGLSDTIRPRIDRFGGDPSRVYVLQAVRDSRGDRAFNLAVDLPALREAIGDLRPVMVYIDPISAYLGKTDSYKDSEVRGVLAPLCQMIEEFDTGLTGIAHLSKNDQRAALHRPGGSIAFVAAARLVFAVATDHNDERRRLLVPIKSNICAPAPALAYRLTEAGDLEWESGPATDVDVASLLSPPRPQDKHEQRDAQGFLRDLLTEGPCASEEILTEAKAQGISRNAVFAAKKTLDARAYKDGFGNSGRWFWRLPPVTQDS